MSPQRWSQLEALYDAAVELAPEERARFLDEQCGEDDDLRRQLTAMLRDNGGFTGAVEQAAAAVIDDATGWIGHRLGPYRVARLIGRGGMGAVYEGVREDAFQKRVAIKLVKFSFDSEFARRRFQRERQILARLEHPNIARLLDGGDYGGHAPYLVMEFVEGEPLLTAAASMTLEAKLRLFQKVLSAVSYAHRELVVHRDLKSANILVTADGEPKLLDFGIARLVDEDAGDEGSRTQTAGSMMTPDYASPEQVKGEPAGVASDIYSLGATFYELLSGARPHALEKYSTAEVYRAICETEPRPPSERAADPRVSRELRGDLDALVLHAMAKDPAARYASAEAFRAEIDRYLEGLPLTVGRASWWKRARKFVRRNRLAVGAGAAVAASLIAGATVSTIQARRAERRFGQVRELANTFLFQFYDQVTPLPGSTAVRASIVETARKYLDGLAKEAGNDRGLLLELAQAYERLGTVQGRTGRSNLGLVDDARRSYQSALALYDGLRVDGRSPGELRQRMAGALYLLSRLEYNSGNHDAAEAAVGRMMPLLGDSSTDPASRRLRASAEDTLGDVRLAQHRNSEGMALLQSSVRTMEELQASGFRDERLASDIRDRRMRLARAKAASGDLDGAIQEFEGAIGSVPPCAADGAVTQACRAVAVYMTWAGDVYTAFDQPNLGDARKGVAMYQRAVEIGERLVAEDGNDRQARFDLAARYGKLGDALIDVDPKRSLELYDRAHHTAATLASKDQLAAIESAYLNAIPRPLLALGRKGEARAAFDKTKQTDPFSGPSAPYPDRVSDLPWRIWESRLLAAEGRVREGRAAIDNTNRLALGLRAERAEDFAPVFFECQGYRALASLSTGEERRKALLASAAVWQSWQPATSFTRREAEKDLAAARQ